MLVKNVSGRALIVDRGRVVGHGETVQVNSLRDPAKRDLRAGRLVRLTDPAVGGPVKETDNG